MIKGDKKQTGIEKFLNESPCVCFNIRKASRAITKIYDDMFREINLSAPQAAVLNALRVLGPLTVLEIADALATDRTTLTRNLKPLERDGYIKIQIGQDRRSRVIVVTNKGKKASEQTMLIFQHFQSKVDSSIGKDKIDKLCRDLCSTVSAIQAL